MAALRHIPGPVRSRSPLASARSLLHRLLVITVILGATIGVALIVGCGDVTPAPGSAGTGAAVPSAAAIDGDARPAVASGAALAAGELQFPAGFMKSVKDYGAVGDGVTDDTLAIKAALADGRSDTTMDYYGRPKALFFPVGTYLVRDTLNWIGCCVTLQGSGPATSIIRLAPGSSGFGDATAPRPLILTPGGNTSFHQNLWDIGFTIGAGNPGATGLDFISNNVGSIHDVAVRSEDGAGHAGIDLTRSWPGPFMIRNVSVTGFDVGLDLLNSAYSATIEFVSLSKQKVAGIRNNGQPIAIRGLESNNTVPAITNTKGFVVLLDSTLDGGSPGNPAVQTDNTAYLRNVSITGYSGALLNNSNGNSALTQGNITEQLIGTPLTLTGRLKPISLKLPIFETPSYNNTNLATWAAFQPRWYGDTAGLQALLNSGKSTIYFPFAAYFSYNEVTVTVPDTVHRIVGFSSVINGGGGSNGGGIRFVVNSTSSTPLIVEQFGYGIKMNQIGHRPVVLKDVTVKDYVNAPGAGRLYLEDVSMGAFTIQPGQNVWARQLNNEVAGTKITNNGGFLWILGLKTEQAGTVIDTETGGRTELLGGLIYPAKTVPATDVAFRSVDSNVSYMYMQPVYCTSCGYAVQVSETRRGKTQTIPANPTANIRMPLFVGYK